MSDFLGRVAARAVGEAPLAQPRVPALFEPGGLDIVETEAVAHAPSTRVAVTPQHRAREVATNRSPATEDRREPVAAAEPVEADSPSREAPLAAPTPPAIGGERDVPPPAPITAPEPAVPLSLAEAVAHVTAPAVPATPAREEARDAPAHAASAQARDEPPPVRVHIGRLEVRANLENAAPAPAPARRPPEAPPQGLTLADYLRGKRVAG